MSQPPFFHHKTSAKLGDFRGSTPAPSLLKSGPSRGWCHPGRTPGSPSRLCVPPPGVSPGRRPQELGMCHGQKKVYPPKKMTKTLANKGWKIGFYLKLLIFRINVNLLRRIGCSSPIMGILAMGIL